MLLYKNNKMEIGLDEAGRGPLIGRVYAGAVIWPENIECSYINDSKKLTPKKREIALKWIEKNIIYWGVGYSEAIEIDKVNILNATTLAMNRAIINLKEKIKDININVNNLIVDGTGWENKFTNMKVESIIKGDTLYYSIAAASIIAKQYHDNHIKQLVIDDPTLDTRYNLSSNMGYPTQKHILGLEKYGASIHHRKTFNRVK